MTQAWLPWLLLQGVLAGADTLLNHEIIARLPHKPGARPELGLHVFREPIWTVLLFGLREWGSRPAALVAAGHGMLSWIITLLAASALAWAVRDTLAWRRLRRASVAAGGATP